MVKIFRNARMRFFDTDSYSGYLKYAIGEIILVVIGILIALQVNNWNEYRKDRLKEKALLSELHKDFKQNLDHFIPIGEKQSMTLRSAQITFRNLPKLTDPISRDSVYRHTTNMFGGWTYFASNGVVESLISSGNFEIIQNDTLRKYLVSWKDVYSRYTQYVHLDIDFWSEQIEPYIMRHGDFVNQAHPKNIRLLNDPVFINMLYRKKRFQENIVSAIQGPDGIEHYLREIVRLSNPEQLLR